MLNQKIKRALYLMVTELCFLGVWLTSNFAPAARPKKINFYFLCIQEPNEVALLDGGRPFGPSAPRGALSTVEDSLAYLYKAYRLSQKDLIVVRA